ncbi:MAG: hypothetical protein NVSMB29_03390 [Candidatus Dormibacteria bacterium]
MPLIRIPSRNGLLWITGVTSAAVIGIIEAPLAIAFAAVPIINEYLNRGGSTASRTSSSSGPAPAGSRRSSRTARASASRTGSKATTAKRSTVRRGARRGARRPAG